jgi:hypothetical protein
MQYVTFLLSRSDASASTASPPDINPGTQNSLPHLHREYVHWAVLMLIRIIAGDNDRTTLISFGPAIEQSASSQFSYATTTKPY